MEVIVIGIVVASVVAGGGMWFYFQQGGAYDPRVQSILNQLNMGKSRSDENPPFYKWGWYEEGENRVSAERMVRQAFRKESLWLNGEDVTFFKTQCEKTIEGKEVREESIHKKIVEIAQRSVHVSNWVYRELTRMIEFVSNLSEAEVVNHLNKAGIKNEEKKDKPFARFMELEVERFLGKIGVQILGPNASGYFLNDGKGKVFRIQSLDAWEQLLRSTQDSAIKIADAGKSTAQKGVVKALKITAEQGVVKHWLRDIEDNRQFIKAMNDLIRKKDLNLSTERPRSIDASFYRWKFDEGKFTQNDHTRWRQLMIRTDLSNRFREIIISKLTDDVGCIETIAYLFHRQVIFFGGMAEARAFACDQYVRHLMALYELVSKQVRVETAPPIIVNISQDEIENMRRAPRRGDGKLTLDVLIEKSKKLTMMKDSIQERSASRRGWILSLGLNEVTQEEAEVLQNKELSKYCRFNCDVADQFDLVNQTPQARQSRLGFLNMVIDHMMDSAAIKARKRRPSFIAT